MGLTHNATVTSYFIFKDYAINFKTIILSLDQELHNTPMTG